MKLGLAGFVALAALIAANRAAAQAAITGSVRDSTGSPIAGATIAITVLNRSAETNEQGQFRLTNVTAGMRMVQVRRVGFTPYSRLVSVADGENTMPPIVLGRLITKLDTVVTEEQMLWRERPLLREMADNMKIGLGHFVLRPELEKLTGMHVSKVFEQQLAVRVVTDTHGHAWIAKRRGIQSMSGGCVELEGKTGYLIPAGANCSSQYCWPKIYLDHQPLSVRPNTVPEVNQFLPENLQAIEIYVGGAQTPARYNTLDSNCGVVILHTRPFIKKEQ